MTQHDCEGATVYDESGEKIGTVKDTYADESGVVRVVKIKMGSLLAKHRLIPVDEATQTDDGVQVPYSKELIERAPDLPDDVDPLSGMVAEDLRGYYATAESPTRSQPSDTERPGAAPVERPESAGEPASSAATPALTDEQIPSTAAASTQQDVGTVRDRGDVVEIPVVEERLVKQPVVTEIIRVRKTAAAEEHDVAATLRKEEVEVDSEGDVPLHEHDDH